MPDPVQLTDLDVITRYSIAVRTATAERGELIETLRADLSWLERGHRRAYAVETPGAEPPEADTEFAQEAAPNEPETPPDREPAQAAKPKKAAARKTAPTKVAAKRTPARQGAKTATRKTAKRSAAGGTGSRRSR